MKKVVIVGGGVAGLSAGIFAQMNGFESVILEKHTLVGGECTGWDRQGYHIDGCMHWLIGTKAGTPIHDLWTTVGALGDVEIHHHDSFLTFEHEGTQVHLYRDLDRLRSSWLAISPEDADAIEEFCRTIKQLHSFEIPVGKPMDMMNLIEKVRFMLSMKDAGMVMRKYGKVTSTEYANTFKHPALRGALGTFVPDHGYSASSILFALGNFTKGQASVPAGGSRAMALRMQERYVSLGGTLKTSAEAVELAIENEHVRSVTCRNGEIFEADYFIVACDAHMFFNRLLRGTYPVREYEARFANPKDYPLASEVRVAVGYAGSMDDQPRALRFPVAAPFQVGATTVKHLLMTHYGYEPDFAPEGHTAITFSINQFHDDYEAWNALDRAAYKEEKARVGQAVLRELETRFPERAGKLTLLDVVTPKTFERYCNAYRGAFMAFIPTVTGAAMAHTGRIKGLDNLHLSGQWVQPPGGLPVALITGRDTIMRLCKQERQGFVNS
jgi:phytoene desaturase